MAQWILRSYDIHNLKTVLRGLGKHVSPAEILATLLPVGELDEITLAELSRAATPRVAADMLASMNLPFAGPLLKLYAEHPGADTTRMEMALESWYYREVSNYIEHNRHGSKVFAAAFALEADITNLITTLRFVHTPTERRIWREQAMVITSKQPGAPGLSSETDAIRRLLVSPGKLPFSLLERLANQDDMGNALKLLAGTDYFHCLDAGLQAYLQSRRLSELEKQLQRFRLHWMAHQIPSDPLGIGVFLGYLALKINEINNLRRIAQGIQAGLKPEAIRAEMEFVS